ncbi:hypothetical protein [Microbispora corallina]|nr:hypothetical protein [Microbispora corallina]
MIVLVVIALVVGTLAAKAMVTWAATWRFIIIWAALCLPFTIYLLLR